MEIAAKDMKIAALHNENKKLQNLLKKLDDPKPFLL